MSSPRLRIPFGVAVTAYGIAQLGGAPEWWNVTTAVVMVVLGSILVARGVVDAQRGRRGDATDAR